MVSSNNKRILRNTGVLYMRMLLAMAVGLYTSRVVLNVLGVDDFGIYHVVSGFVALLGFMQGAMTTATQRYFAFDLGECNGSNLRCLFNTSLQIHALIAACIALVAETAGYWFVTTQLTIQPERLEAAIWAYHLSVSAFAVNVMTVPLTAMLMANERMGLFALMSMVEVLLKLAAVLLLQNLVNDKLMLYAALLLGVAMITFSGYLLINRILFQAVRLQWVWHAQSFRSMLSFTAWNTWGNLAAALSGHGNNVLLNIFFGPGVNAGRSIATQANGALNSFVVNVQAAINPQIVKLYASGNKEQMLSLILGAAKYNFYILFILALPVLLNTEVLLHFWLTEVPPYAAIFLQLTIITSLIDSVSGPLMTSAQATGNIRLYHSVVGGLLLLNVPFSYLLLLNNMPPETVLLVTIALSITALAARLRIIAPMIELPISAFCSKVLAKGILVLLTASIIGYYLKTISEQIAPSVLPNLIIGLISPIITIWLLGLEKIEKHNLIHALKSLRVRLG